MDVNAVEVLKVEWNRLNISSVLLIFWALRVIEQILFLITDMEKQNETLIRVVKIVLIKGIRHIYGRFRNDTLRNILLSLYRSIHAMGEMQDMCFNF